jgi:nucleotide-binding universal stress UspA family protein
MWPLKTILHPTDFSRCSQDAFRLACSLARDHGARLIVLHVVSLYDPVTRAALPGLERGLRWKG